MPKKIKTPEELARAEATKIKKGFIERVLKKHEIVWPRELKIMNQLAANYPNLDFWSVFKITFYIPSLAWFLTEKGKEYLAQEYRRQTTDLSALVQKVEVETPQETIAALNSPEITPKKPMTLRDFLK